MAGLACQALSVTLLKGLPIAFRGLPMARGRTERRAFSSRRRDLDSAETRTEDGRLGEMGSPCLRRTLLSSMEPRVAADACPRTCPRSTCPYDLAGDEPGTRANDEALFAVLESVPGSRYKVLNADDQIIRTAII